MQKTSESEKIFGVGVCSETVIGRLCRVNSADGAQSGKARIALILSDDISSLSFFELAEGYIGAIICTGYDVEFARKARELGLSCLFCGGSEQISNAVGNVVLLVPQKNVCYLEPCREQLCRFSKEQSLRYDRDRKNKLEEDLYLVGEEVFGCIESKYCGAVAEVPVCRYDEEYLFETLRDYAEYSQGKPITLLMGGECFEDRASEWIYDCVRAVCRAGVYGKISVAVSGERAEYIARVSKIIEIAAEELEYEGREHCDDIELGVFIDSVCAYFLSRDNYAGRFTVINVSCVLGEKYTDAHLDALFYSVYERLPRRVSRVLIISDCRNAEKTEKSAQIFGRGKRRAFISVKKEK